MHDIGKVSIPGEILTKPCSLSKLEYEMIKTHPLIAYDILKNMNFEGPVAEIVLQHHERLNGKGYPYGIKGNEILIESKILAVADTIEAIISHRPYRQALSIEYAIEEILRLSSEHYCPTVVSETIDLLNCEDYKSFFAS